MFLSTENMTLDTLQLEDAEFARSSAIKSKQNSELELTDVQIQVWLRLDMTLSLMLVCSWRTS